MRARQSCLIAGAPHVAEDLVDHVEQLLSAVHDPGDALLLLRIQVAEHSIAKDLGVGDDSGQRCPQVVRDVGQELRLQPVELLQLDEALSQLTSLERAPDRRAQLVHVGRLDEIVVRATAQRGDRRLERRVSGQHDRHRVGPELLRLAEDLDPIKVVEPQVGEHDVELVLPELFQGCHAARDGRDLVPVELEDGLDRRRDALLVVDDEDLIVRHRPAVPRPEA